MLDFQNLISIISHLTDSIINTEHYSNSVRLLVVLIILFHIIVIGAFLFFLRKDSKEGTLKKMIELAGQPDKLKDD